MYLVSLCTHWRPVDINAATGMSNDIAAKCAIKIGSLLSMIAVSPVKYGIQQKEAEVFQELFRQYSRPQTAQEQKYGHTGLNLWPVIGASIAASLATSLCISAGRKLLTGLKTEKKERSSLKGERANQDMFPRSPLANTCSRR